MKELEMYSKIKDLQKRGFSVRKSAKILGISRDTVKKYQQMSLEEYMATSESTRKLSSLVEFKSIILDWLYEFPDMSSAQIYDWLLEHYRPNVSERSVSRYVRDLRIEYNIAKIVVPREYEAMDELPMGHQIQMDFGVKNMPLSNRQGYRKVYFAGMVLANSRYKWGYFQNRPFTSSDLIRAMDGCFNYFGGITKEIVVDQDSIIVVSENNGDIIYTYEFEQYKQQMDFKMRVCRGQDPESKGMVESVVKFVKRNYLPHRYYMEPDVLNQSFLAWLNRTGNAKLHGTTKKVPAQVFEFEREHLRAVPAKINNLNPSIMRTVRKDNTLLYNSNRYSLPLGTYTNHPQVAVFVTEDHLEVYDEQREHLIAEHTICPLRGTLIKLTEHRRDKTGSLDKLEAGVLEYLNGPSLSEWQTYLRVIRSQMPRYYRDQLTLLKLLIGEHPRETLEEAMLYCLMKELYSINDVKNAVAFLKQQDLELPAVMPSIELLNNQGLMTVKTQKRKLEEYEFAGGDFSE